MSMKFLVFVMACLATLRVQGQTPISFVKQAPVVDGSAKDVAWMRTGWHPLDQLWAGTLPNQDDFTGRYKVVATVDALYLLAEIVDDTLIDIHADPKDHYWDDDCLEIFVDEDASGGDHQYNHQAFAYHLSLAGDAADLGTKQQPILFNPHVQVKHVTEGTTTTWELKMKLYPKSFSETDRGPKALSLQPGKKLGLAVAYCDNDASPEREHFLGSMPIPGLDKNRAWKDASLFERFEIVKGN